jgi:hypothetical protein
MGSTYYPNNIHRNRYIDDIQIFLLEKSWEEAKKKKKEEEEEKTEEKRKKRKGKHLGQIL